MNDLYNIDELLKTKPYQELDTGEKEFVDAEIGSEADYNHMRSTLLLIGASIAEDEVITPDPKIKENLLAQFDQDGRTKVIWLNAVGAWLLPTEKKVYQMPIAQIAASVAILITATFMFNTFTEDQNPDLMAQNDHANATEVTETNEEATMTDEADKLEDAEAAADQTIVPNNDQDVEIVEANGTGATTFQWDVAEDEGPATMSAEPGLADMAAPTGGSFSLGFMAMDSVGSVTTTTTSADFAFAGMVDEFVDITDGESDMTNTGNAADAETVIYSNPSFFTTDSRTADSKDIPALGVTMSDNDELFGLLFSTL